MQSRALKGKKRWQWLRYNRTQTEIREYKIKSMHFWKKKKGNIEKRNTIPSDVETKQQ